MQNRWSGFTRLLDSLRETEQEPGSAFPPSMPFDLPGVAEGTEAFGTARAQPGFAAAAYEQNDGTGFASDRPAGSAPRHAESPEAPPSIDPAAVATELSLNGKSASVLVRARRDFALRNHPDRVHPELRERAVRRMQIANALFDEALRRAGRPGRE